MFETEKVNMHLNLIYFTILCILFIVLPKAVSSIYFAQTFLTNSFSRTNKENQHKQKSKRRFGKKEES